MERRASRICRKESGNLLSANAGGKIGIVLQEAVDDWTKRLARG